MGMAGKAITMITAKYNSNYGNHAYTISADVPEGLTPLVMALVVEGLANVGFRVAGSSVDKALKLGENSRKSVVYSDETARAIEAAVAEKLEKLQSAETDPMPEGISFEVTGEHVFGEAGSAMVRATQFVDLLMAADEAKLREVLGMFDETAAEADRDGLIAIAHKAGLGQQKGRKK